RIDLCRRVRFEVLCGVGDSDLGDLVPAATAGRGAQVPPLGEEVLSADGSVAEARRGLVLRRLLCSWRTGLVEHVLDGHLLRDGGEAGSGGLEVESTSSVEGLLSQDIRVYGCLEHRDQSSDCVGGFGRNPSRCSTHSSGSDTRLGLGPDARRAWEYT